MRVGPGEPGRRDGQSGQPARAPAPGRRRGLALVVAAALIMLIGSAALLIRRATSEQYLEAHRYTFGEIAMNLAGSGMNLFMEHLRESGLSPGSELHRILVTTGYEELEGRSHPVSSPHLDELAAQLGDGASVSVSVQFRDFQPFYHPSGLRGLAVDPREKVGELAVVSRGEYRGVTRTLVAARRVKVVSVVAPVLAKFTLFVRDQEGGGPNLLAYDRTRPDAGFRLGGQPAQPLVLFHSAERTPAVVDGRFFSLADSLGTQAPDLGGLVYLGGHDPWYLNLVHGAGAGRDEELHLLRRTRYRIPSSLPGVKSAYGLTFGFYDGILASGKFGSAARPAGPPRPTGGLVADATAALHLFGDRDNVTPTLVLGPVFRSYVTGHLLDGLWYPYRSQAEFQALPDSGPFRGSYEAYKRVMVRVVEEPYDRGLDYLASNTETLQEDGTVEAEGTPFVPPAGLVQGLLTRALPVSEADRAFVDPVPGSPTPGFVRLQRPIEGASAEEIFRGALQDLDGPLLEKLLLAKATATVEDQADLHRRFLVGNRLELPGIVRVVRGDVELPAIDFGLGGMLLVPGNLTLTGPVSSRVPDRTLTLVSLGGDLVVATGERVRAGLVALRGRLQARGSLDLLGALAVQGLDLPALVAGPGRKVITYDRALDPTDAAAYATQLRVGVERQLRLHLEGH